MDVCERHRARPVRWLETRKWQQDASDGNISL
jgi:hypothetical protein